MKRSTKTRQRLPLMAATAVAVAFSGLPSGQAIADPDDRPRSSAGLARDQETVNDRFRRLDKRMADLAEKLEKRQPGEAERLRKAYGEVRKRLVRLDMDEVLKALRGSNLFAARGRLKEVMDDLDTIVEILRGEVERNEKELKERLKQLNSQIKDVKKLVDKQRKINKEGRKDDAERADAEQMQDVKKQIDALREAQKNLESSSQKSKVDTKEAA